MITRIGIGIIFCVVSLILPWWLFLLIGIPMVFFYHHFYELFFMALFLDLIYSEPSGKFWGFRFALTVSAVVILVIITALKQRLKNHLYV
ncbi:MAG: hypothetical protein WC673_03175 [Candidatus Paceibacterota bacterium]|jgi:hypothetical protein